MALPFIPSDAAMLAVQAGVVLAPRGELPELERLRRLAGRWWALVPLGSIVVVIFAIRGASQTATGLTYLALIAVPILAAIALGWGIRLPARSVDPARPPRAWRTARRADSGRTARRADSGRTARRADSRRTARPARPARPAIALLVAPLFAAAWVWRTSLGGEASATALSALSCVTLGILLAALTPASWLKVGIVLMAVGDSYLVVTNLLQAPNDVLSAAHPAAGLPRLQLELFGGVQMGYGDLFIAGVFGAVLAREGRRQLPAAVLTLALAGVFDLLFLVVDELPATVPVALALVVEEALNRRRQTASEPYRPGSNAGSGPSEPDRPGPNAGPGPSRRAGGTLRRVR